MEVRILNDRYRLLARRDASVKFSARLFGSLSLSRFAAMQISQPLVDWFSQRF